MPFRSRYRDVPDMFGRDKSGRIQGGHSADDAKRVTKVGRDEDGKTFGKVKGTPLTAAQKRENAKQAKKHQKALKDAQKAAKQARRGK